MSELILQHGHLLINTLAGFVVALACGPAAIWLARRLHLMDIPGRSAHKCHARPTPLAGGIVLAFSLLALLPIYRLWQGPMFVVLLSGLIVFAFGLWDDAKGLTASKKFIGQFIASIILIAADYTVHFIGNITFGFLDTKYVAIADWVVTIFWFVGITNGFNLIDSMDGLAVGVAGIGFASFAFMASVSNMLPLAGFSAIMFGICLGIYFNNRTPARLFLGDAGALSLGFILAAVAMIYTPLDSVPQSASWFVPILILGYPIFDTTLVVVSRLRRQTSIFKADRTHTYHRLLALGMKPSQAVWTIHGAALLLGLVGIAVVSHPTVSSLLFVIVLCAGAMLIVYLEKVHWPSSLGGIQAIEQQIGTRESLDIIASGRADPNADLEFDFIVDYLACRLYPNRPFPPLPHDLNWDQFYALLIRHRLAAHFHEIGREYYKTWPDEFYQQLRMAQLSLLVYGEHSVKRVQTVLSNLKEWGIPVVVLKGWALIPKIYGGDYSQRFCSDLDILIRPADMDASENALEAIGCHGAIENWPGFRRNYLKVRPYYFPTQMPILGIEFTVGLHWNLLHAPFDSHLIDVNQLFERAQPTTIAGVPALELSIEDRIVYACSHVALHHYSEPLLFYFYELAAEIRLAGSALHWPLVLERASQWQKIVPLRSILSYMDSLWPDIVPGAVLEELARMPTVPLERFVNRWLRWTKGRSPFNHLLAWLTYFDPMQRFFIMLQELFPSPQYMRERYGRAPGGFWPLLYIRRFLRGTGWFRN